MSVPPRDLTPLMRWVRDTLLGRKYKNAHRFQDFLATRSPPPPELPDGPSHQLSNNYYFTRDGRRTARPPVILIDETKRKALTAGGKESVTAAVVSTKKLGSIVPGKPYVWHEAQKKDQP